MKKALVLEKKVLFYIFILFFLIIHGYISDAHANPSIKIYTQSKYSDLNKYGSYRYYDRNNDKYVYNQSLKDLGCRTFSFVHAIEWLTETADSDKTEDTLMAFVNVTKSPCDDGMKPYADFINKRLWNSKLIKVDCGLSYKPNNPKAWRNDFASKHVFVVNTQGHFVAAVDYVICDKNLNVLYDNPNDELINNQIMFVQIIDSSPTSSFHSYKGKKRAFYKAPWYTMDEKNNKLIEHTGDPDYGGKTYWIEYKYFVNCWWDYDSRFARLQGGSWKGHMPRVKLNDYQEFAVKENYLAITDTYLYTQPIKDAKYMASALYKDFGFIAIGTCEDECGYLWYVTEDHLFIRENDVNKAERRVLEDLPEATHVGYIDAIVKQIKYDRVWLRDKPYSADTARLIPVSKNDQLRIKRVVKNSYGNYWVQFDNDYYLCANNVELVGYKTTSDMFKINNYQGPKEGQDYPLTTTNIHLAGKIKIPTSINNYVAGWYDSQGNPVVPESRGSFDNKATELNIDDKINKELKGKELIALGKGNYIYRIKVYGLMWHDVIPDNENPLTVFQVPLEFEYPFTVGGGTNTAEYDDLDPTGDVFFYAYTDFVPTIHVEGIHLNEQSLQMKVGETKYLTVSTVPENAIVDTVTWSSDNSNVARVANGKVTAVGPGTATITAVSDDDNTITDTCSVTVIRLPDMVTVSGRKDLYINDSVQKTVQLTALVGPEDVSDPNVSWSSSNENVATVSQNGLVTALSVGEVTIKATANGDTSVVDYCTINVKAYVDALEIKGAAQIAVGSDKWFSVSISPIDASNQTIVWRVDNTSKATIEQTGKTVKLHGLAPGTITVTATADDRKTVYDQFQVEVYQPIQDITISGVSALHTGETTTLSAQVLPQNADVGAIRWSTSNADIAMVNSLTGNVTAVGNGVSTITAYSEEDPTVKDTHVITVTTLIDSLSIGGLETVDVGTTQKVTATILPETASNKKLTWTCDDETLATVDSEGNITGLLPGYVTITATTTDGTNISSSFEVEIFQKIQSISVDVEPSAYLGNSFVPDVIILPENASRPYVEWVTTNDDIVSITEECETNGPYSVMNCVGTGTVKLTARATDGSGVSGFAYVQVKCFAELDRHELSYQLYTTGDSSSTVNRLYITADTLARAAEGGYGVHWNVEHVSGNYASAVRINERTYTYHGFTLANAVDLKVAVNKAGSDVYKVSCTINGFTDSCLITVNVAAPAVPLPESVSLASSEYHGKVNDLITVNAMPICSPSGTALSNDVKTYLYGIGSFSRYAKVTMSESSFTVQFSKAGVYSGKVRFVGANYQYETSVGFIITNDDGTVIPDVERLSFDDSVMNLIPGEIGSLKLSVYPSGAEDRELTWSSSAPEVASVNNSGMVTALKTGTSIITVSADNSVSATGVVYVTESVLSIDWDMDNHIRVYTGGNTKVNIQRINLTPRASASLSYEPSWSLRRLDGNNLTLNCSPITTSDTNGNLLYGCDIILKSVSDIGSTSYELTCTDGTYAAATTIIVDAYHAQDTLPSLVNWESSVFTGNIDQLIQIYPNVHCWPSDTGLPEEVTVTLLGDQYWNEAINRKDLSISRNSMSFSFSAPGVYQADCVYACANMKYVVPITVRIKDAGGNVPVRAMNVTLNTTEVSIEPNETFQLKAMIAPVDTTNKEVLWSSADTSIATVTSSGLVRGVSNGSTFVWCTPSDQNCKAVKCLVVVEDLFTVIQTDEMKNQYLQGETGHAVSSFILSNGTWNRLQSEGLTTQWSLTRVSGQSADVELREVDGAQYIVVTSFNNGGQDVYEVTCTAGTYRWTGRSTLTVTDLGITAPDSFTLSSAQYSAAIGEEIELDFTPVCLPATSSIPTELEPEYIGIGEFYSALDDAHRTVLYYATGNTVKVGFRRAGTFVLSRVYTKRNLTYVTECTINVGEGTLNLLNCSDPDAIVYVGGKSTIAATCVISDISVQELYGNDIVWRAERIYGDCMTVALKADQSSASLYVVNAHTTGTECWRVSCSFHDVTCFTDVIIHAVEAADELPESISLNQTSFDGMIGQTVCVPLTVSCAPKGTKLPETSDEAWSYATDGFGNDNAQWNVSNGSLNIVFAESGYYGGRLIYRSGNVSFEIPLSFAITDEESVQKNPLNLVITTNHDTITIYPEGEINVPIVKAALLSGDTYNAASVASYATIKNAQWSVSINSGSACSLSVRQVTPASVQLVVDQINATGNITYTLECSLDGEEYTATGSVHVAAADEARPQALLLQDYYVTPTGTALTIDASFYDKTSGMKLCSGSENIWENEEALAAMGYQYGIETDYWLPTFYDTGSYWTTVTGWIGNLRFEEGLLICAYHPATLPSNPAIMILPSSLRMIEAEAFEGVPVNIVDMRISDVNSIGNRAFANCTSLMKVYLTESVTAISENAFDKCDKVVFICTNGSYAETWAKQHGIPVFYSDN